MIYLDNCSTTIIRKEVIEAITESLKNDIGNPSSLHELGFKAEKKINKVREQIASYLGVGKEELYFTSGGTEGNNIGIKSSLKKQKNRGKHIITTSIEHPSVLSVYKELEKDNYQVDYISVNKDGIINIKDLESKIRKDTVLISIMQVNNELGSIQPIEEVKKLISKLNPNIIFHVDGVQGFGKLKINLKDKGIDIYTFSGHKIHGPKGIGGIYINKDLKLEPCILGGNQERGFRSGTENVAGIVGLGKALELMDKNYEEESRHILTINKYFREKIKSIKGIKINTNFEKSSPYILNLTIDNIRGEILLHFLEREKIYISTSSACSSNSDNESYVLKNIGLKSDQIASSIRICFAYSTSNRDIDILIDEMKKAIEEIRNIIMR